MSFPDYFFPSSNTITSITKSNPGVVTTATPHGYLEGIQVRLVIPQESGMNKLNGNVYLATILSPTTFSIDQDTTNFDAFSVSSTQPSEVIPVGEVATTLENAVKNNYTIIPEN
jgi:hypothetical protein